MRKLTTKDIQTQGGHCRAPGTLCFLFWGADVPSPLSLSKEQLILYLGGQQKWLSRTFCHHFAAPTANKVLSFLLASKQNPHTENVLVDGVKGVISHFTKWRKLRQALLVPDTLRLWHLFKFKTICRVPFLSSYRHLPLMRVIRILLRFWKV
jgi:hypothetical protein